MRRFCRKSPLTGVSQASCLQVSRAYEAHYGEKIPGNLPFSEAARQMAKDMGNSESVAFILSQSNDPNT